jgi:hypothetical protein
MSENWIKVDKDNIRYVWICPKCNTKHYYTPSPHRGLGGVDSCSNDCVYRMRGEEYYVILEYSHAEILENN